MYLPDKFADKMQRLLGNEYDNYLACFDEPRYYGLRVNTGKISVEKFRQICPFEITPVPWISNGFYYDGDQTAPSKHPYYAAGLYYLQEPSAMTPADRLPIEPGDRVLDLCAAPGGKATELGAKLGATGLLAANDISNSRARGLLKNIEVFGIGNVLVLSEEPGKLTDYFPEYFDKILIDAPCSGEGMFRKERKMIRAWEEHGPEYFRNIQKSIILQAAQMLRPGGQMLYSTCTFDPMENEGIIRHLIHKCPEFEIEEMKGYEGFANGIPEAVDETGNGEAFKEGTLNERTLNERTLNEGTFKEEALKEGTFKEGTFKEEALRKTVRIFPHRMKGEGHFLALLRKGNIREASAEWKEKPEREEKTNRERKTEWEGKAEQERKTGREYSGFRERKTALPEEFLRFLSDVEKDLEPKRMALFGERIYYMPEGLPDMRGIRFLRTGLLLGELKKNRFEPSQAFAMSLKKEEYRKVFDFPVQDDRVMRYLKGETLDVSDLADTKEKGWYLVCVDSFPLGWGKLGSGMLKNKYLPGWRLV